MNVNSILNIRNSKYDILFKDLKKNRISFKKFLLLYEISFDKNDHKKLKNLIYKYISKSLNVYFNINLKSKSVNILKYEKLILNLPNITPNGVIVPKKEIIQEYTNIQNYLIKIMDKYKLDSIIKTFEICDVRLMRSNKSNYNAKRSYSSSNVHSDNWSGNPCDAKIAMYIDGDKKNTIEFYKPKKINNKFFDKKNDYKKAIQDYGFKKIKEMNVNKITIFDQACLHKTKNKNCGIRLSIDFGIILKENISKKILLKRYKDRFIKNRSILNINKLTKILKPQSIFSENY